MTSEQREGSQGLTGVATLVGESLPNPLGAKEPLSSASESGGVKGNLRENTTAGYRGLHIPSILFPPAKSASRQTHSLAHQVFNIISVLCRPIQGIFLWKCIVGTATRLRIS